MYFPHADISVSPFIPPLVAFVISFFTSMGGVSGAFLLLPFQMSFLGYTNPSVSATNQVFNIVAIPGGVIRFIREGRMVWPLTITVIIGTLPGVLVGAVIRVKYLPDPTAFKMFAALVLLYICVKMMKELLKKGNTNGRETAEERFRRLVREFESGKKRGERLPAVEVTKFTITRIEYRFYGETYSIPFWGIMTLSLVVGIIGGIYGIGGGAIISPFLVSFFGLPIYTVAGAALMGTFITSVAGVTFYHLIALYYPEISVAPDWSLGFLFGIGGLAGIYLGARCQKYIPARYIKWMLCTVMLFTSIKYLIPILHRLF